MSSSLSSLQHTKYGWDEPTNFDLRGEGIRELVEGNRQRDHLSGGDNTSTRHGMPAGLSRRALGMPICLRAAENGAVRLVEFRCKGGAGRSLCMADARSPLRRAVDAYSARWLASRPSAVPPFIRGQSLFVRIYCSRANPCPSTRCRYGARRCVAQRRLALGCIQPVRRPLGRFVRSLRC